MRLQSAFPVTLLVLLLGTPFLFGAASVNPQDELEQSYTTDGGEVTVWWGVDAASETVDIALELELDLVGLGGWVAFGLCEPGSGSMPGADTVICTYSNHEREAGYNDDGEDLDLVAGSPSSRMWNCVDGYATEFAQPSRDDADPTREGGGQDWAVVSSSFDGETGRGKVRLKRALDTGDPIQDRAIVNTVTVAPVPVLLAKGGLRLNAGGVGGVDIAYHTPTSRWRTSIHFFESAGTVDKTRSSAEVLLAMPDFAFVASFNPETVVNSHLVTDYRRTNADYSTLFGDRFHNNLTLIGLVPIWSTKPNVSGLVHHIVVGALCPDLHISGFNVTRPLSWTRIGVFTAGTQAVIFPQHVGFRLGACTSIRQTVHYNNPGHVSGVVDSSGITLYLAETPRQHELGIFAAGDERTTLRASKELAVLPAGASKYTFQCTLRLDSPLHVLSQNLHAHSHTKRFSSTFSRDGVPYSTSDVQFYDNHRAEDVLWTAGAVEDGDLLNVSCYYSTGPWGEDPSKFGAGTNDEMCIVFLIVYPISAFKNDFDMCDYDPNRGSVKLEIEKLPWSVMEHPWEWGKSISDAANETATLTTRYTCTTDTSIKGTADVRLSNGKTDDLGYSSRKCASECTSKPSCKSFVWMIADGYCELWSKSTPTRVWIGAQHCVRTASPPSLKTTGPTSTMSSTSSTEAVSTTATDGTTTTNTTVTTSGTTTTTSTTSAARTARTTSSATARTSGTTTTSKSSAISTAPTAISITSRTSGTTTTSKSSAISTAPAAISATESLSTTSSPSAAAGVTTLGDGIPDAEYCETLCRAWVESDENTDGHTGCFDAGCGSNQFLSCSQACTGRRLGATETECMDVCTSARKCSFTLGGQVFGACKSCHTDTDACLVGSIAGCEHACAAASGRSGLNPVFSASRSSTAPSSTAPSSTTGVTTDTPFLAENRAPGLNPVSSASRSSTAPSSITGVTTDTPFLAENRAPSLRTGTGTHSGVVVLALVSTVALVVAAVWFRQRQRSQRWSMLPTTDQMLLQDDGGDEDREDTAL